MDISPAIYLDYNATTPVAPEVVNEMLPYFLTAYGNASSNDHILGWQAKQAVDEARGFMANGFDIAPNELVFTAGATESINLVLRGLFLHGKTNSGHIITVNTEHNAVLDTCKVLEENGVEVDYLPVDKNGIISLAHLEDSIRPDTRLVCIMMVNNETGVIQPIQEISAICKKNGVMFMSDATQAIGKIAINPVRLGMDIMVGSAHKFYGPKGVGFLYVKKDILTGIDPIITGGGQESRKRAGTTNVPSIIGMAKALAVCIDQLDEDTDKISKLRQLFETKLTNNLVIKINGAAADRLYNVTNISFDGVDSERLMQAIGTRVAASRGSACSTGKIEPSHVLSAMGISADDALSAIRFSFGRYTTEHEVDIVIDLITEAAKRLKISN